MKDLWAQFRSWCNGIDETLFEELTFQKGVSSSQIRAAEDNLPFQLPEDFVASLKLYDGQEKWFQQGWLIDGMGLLPLERLVERYQEELKLAHEYGFEPEGEAQDEGRILDVVFHPKRIPIAEHEGVCGLWLDFTPAINGTAGQVIFNLTECDYYVVGTSFSHFFQRYLKLLESGRVKCQRDVENWCFRCPELTSVETLGIEYYRRHDEIFRYPLQDD